MAAWWVSQPALGAQGVAVAHGPERVVRVAERGAEVLEAVQLLVAGLPHLAVHENAVVPVDGGGAGRHGAGRALRAVVRVAGDAVFGGDVRPGHLEEAELGSHLEEGVTIGGIAMQGGDVGDHGGDAERIAFAGPIAFNVGQLFLKSTGTLRIWAVVEDMSRGCFHRFLGSTAARGPGLRARGVRAPFVLAKPPTTTGSRPGNSAKTESRPPSAST